MRLDELRFGIVQPDCRGTATRAHPPPTGRAYHRHMLLVIDAGNSHVTVGLARDGDLIASRRAASRASATPDELEVMLEGLLRLDCQGLAGAAAVAVDRPGDVGPDRLVNAYAAAHLLGTPVIVVDCGTATTFDAVDSQGAFVGGAIAPPTN